jgi:hypothetical protein
VKRQSSVVPPYVFWWDPGGGHKCGAVAYASPLRLDCRGLAGPVAVRWALIE